MTHDPNVKIIENAYKSDVRPGDHVTWEKTRRMGGGTITERREGIAHHRDGDGDWWTKDGMWITCGEDPRVTITIRRTVASEESAL